jgi:hypothetical protein
MWNTHKRFDTASYLTSGKTSNQRPGPPNHRMQATCSATLRKRLIRTVRHRQKLRHKERVWTPTSKVCRVNS